mgnify:CR=1 FL=1
MLFFTQRLRDSITPTARTWTPRTITWRLWAAIILIPVFMPVSYTHLTLPTICSV